MPQATAFSLPSLFPQFAVLPAAARWLSPLSPGLFSFFIRSFPQRFLISHGNTVTVAGVALKVCGQRRQTISSVLC